MTDRNFLQLGLCAVLTLALSVSLATLPAAAEEGAPRAVVDEPLVDLGVVPKGNKVDAIFIIRNEGDAPLEITDVRPGCGCTVADYDKVIAPGESGRISSEVDTTNLFGPNNQSILVLTNDPENPRIALTIRNEVKPFIGAYPGYARFNIVQMEESQGTINQILWSTDASDFKVVSVTAPGQFFTADFRRATEEELQGDETAKEHSQWAVSLTLRANAPIGPLTGHLEIVTDHPQQKNVKIPVSGFVRPILVSTPPRVNFREIDLTNGMYTNLLIKNFATEGIQIKEAKVQDLDGATVEITPIEEGRRYQVRLTLSSEMAETKGNFNGVLTLVTDSEKVPNFEIPITGNSI
ncbi:MAG: DUF1573 domain-containing protein [Acidobacteriota bacterium]